MLEQLVESTNHPSKNNRRESFLLTAFTAVFLLVTLMLIYSLFSRNLAMANENSDLSQLAAPVEMPAEKPAPPPEKAEAIKPRDSGRSIDRLPVRELNMQRVDEIPNRVPTEISVSKNTQLARPAGEFKIGGKDDVGSFSTSRANGEAGNFTGLNQSAGLPINENAAALENTSPPPVVKKPEIKPAAAAPPKVSIQSGGVVNGKATKLVTPVYPPPAKAVRAFGIVNVQVLIDEEGNVVSANAASGHPLLRQAAEQAARASKFSSTFLSNQKVKVTGVIVYNFVAQ